MLTTELIDFINRLCVIRHQCSRVVIIGSFARGDSGAASDIDVVGFSTNVAQMKNVTVSARSTGAGLAAEIDLKILPAAAFDEPDSWQLRLRGGRVIHGMDEAFEGYLRKLDAMEAAGPKVP